MARMNPYLQFVEDDSDQDVQEVLPPRSGYGEPQKEREPEGNPYYQFVGKDQPQPGPAPRARMTETAKAMQGRRFEKAPETSGFQKGLDYAKGAGQQLLEDTSSMARLGAQALPYMVPAFAPGALMHGNPLPEMVDKANLPQYGPLPEGPQSPEEHLGADTLPILEMAGGGAAGLAKMAAKPLAKQMAKATGPEARRVAGEFVEDVRPGSAQAMPKAQKEARRQLDEAETSPGNFEQILEPMTPTEIITQGVDGFRGRVFKFMEEGRARHLPEKLKRKLMAFDGMDVHDWMRLRQKIDDNLRPKKFASNPQKYSAYAEVSTMMDDLAKTLPDNQALLKFSRGQSLYKTVQDYKGLVEMVKKGIKRGPNGQQQIDSKRILTMIDKLDAKTKRRYFGTEVARAVETLERAQGRSFAMAEKARKKANKKLRGWLGGVGLFGSGIGTAAYYKEAKVALGIAQAPRARGGATRAMPGSKGKVKAQ